MLIGIATIPEFVNTGQYFCQPAVDYGHDVRVIHSPSTASLSGLDLLLVVDPMLQHPAILRSAPCPVAGYLVDVHQQLDVRRAYARYFDHVFVAQRDYITHFASLPHPSAHWLPLACDPAIHFVPRCERTHDVAFIGKLGYAGTERRRVLDYILSRFETNEQQRFYAPLEMGAVYSRSKIVFNKSINGDVNMRVFEALASGALLVTDRVANGLSDVATEGVHFVGYDTAEEAYEKITYYLAHDRERLAIAAAGQSHVFKHHTYARRLKTILATVSAARGAKAPARTAEVTDEIAWRSECYRLQGASIGVATSLLAEGGWSTRSITNTAVAAARGIVRPIRQRFRRP